MTGFVQGRQRGLGGLQVAKAAAASQCNQESLVGNGSDAWGRWAAPGGLPMVGNRSGSDPLGALPLPSQRLLGLAVSKLPA